MTSKPNFSLEQIEKDLFKLREGFPIDAVQAAVTLQTDITPTLLTWLNNAIDDAGKVPEDNIGHMFALFLLSQFREKSAFESVIRLARLPEETLDYLIADCITDDLHRFIASTYNGDLSAIKNLIEDPQVNLWSRIAALESLAILVHEGMLAIDDIAPYLSSLFNNKAIFTDEHLISYLVSTCCYLDAQRFQEEIQKAFKDKKVDPLVMDADSFKNILANPAGQSLDELESMITDTVYEMEDWDCFNDSDDEDELLEDEAFSPVQVVNDSPKIGRNDPCPCNSGKKYKKCCLV